MPVASHTCWGVAAPIRPEKVFISCLWLASCSTVRVVLPTVPETPGHHPQPRVYRRSDANRIMTGIVRRQAVGAASGTGQAVSMGTATSGSTCSPVTPRKLGRTLSPCTTWSIHGAVRMAMARYLARGQRRAADSAGNTRPPPSTPRLPGLRRGSHNARNSTAAGCWQHRNWPRKGCACATGCRQFVRFRDRNQRPMSLTQEPRSWKFLFQIQRRQKYAYAQPAAPR